MPKIHTLDTYKRSNHTTESQCYNFIEPFKYQIFLQPFSSDTPTNVLLAIFILNVN